MKCIHILSANEIKFQKPLFLLINNEEYGFNPSQHYFITPHISVYEELIKNHKNIILDNSGDHLINKYAPKCDLLIVQGIPNRLDLLRVKSSYYRKLVIRTWGGGRQVYNHSGSIYSKIKTRILDYFYYLYVNLTIGRCCALGIANYVDVLDIRKWIKRVKLYELPLTSGEDYRIIERIKHSDSKEDISTLNILLGHQGEPSENHIKWLNVLLDRFGNEDIHIYIPLSYGNQLYIDTIMPKLQEYKSTKITIITDFMPLDKYLSFLNTIDVAILDEVSSMALGNIAYLLSLDKKIVLNANGIINDTFELLNIPCYLTKDLYNISLSQLKSEIRYPEESIRPLASISIEYVVERWLYFLQHVIAVH